MLKLKIEICVLTRKDCDVINESNVKIPVKLKETNLK